MTPPAELDPKLAHVGSQWPDERPLHACRFDGTGKLLFCGGEDANLHRFRLPDGVRTTCPGGHVTWIQSLAVSKDGRQIYSGGCDGRLIWWEAAGDVYASVRVLEAHRGWIRSIDTSPDGTLIATGGNDKIVRIWNAANGDLLRELPGHGRHVYSVAFHPAGEFLLSGDLVGELKQWEIATGKLARSFDAKALHTYEGGQQVDYGGVRALAFSTDGKWLAAGGLNKASNPLGAVNEPLVLLFDWESQKLVKQLTADGIPGGYIARLCWIRDGSLMGLSSGTSGGILLFWKVDAEKAYHRLQLPANAHDMDVHPDGIQVATAHADRHVRITKLAAS